MTSLSPTLSFEDDDPSPGSDGPSPEARNPETPQASTPAAPPAGRSGPLPEADDVEMRPAGRLSRDERRQVQGAAERASQARQAGA